MEIYYSRTGVYLIRLMVVLMPVPPREQFWAMALEGCL